ncbi:type II toxin-antitoxin system RelE/ParE family toxin [Akkermansiaceae bacterium]|nr:type II toxin-antitoxin system RelE/ParE family toxin [Akkermansiaceae bacterium]MDB4547021.1 type II toxin-antitoxin system RelE/ParE family toxin [Akkermansiaceae bacterium]MDB4725504.1 type II toxin-antitoxin system RelE/ParE family toxin [Akkermansiaceae bacterium]
MSRHETWRTRRYWRKVGGLLIEEFHAIKGDNSHNVGRSALVRVALRKLIQLNQAGKLTDMAVPPGNRLEALKRNLVGFHSIRINDQWRIIFKWTDSGPAEVAIVDYH